jgi:hypothetical protein
LQAKRPWWGNRLSRELAKLGLGKPCFKFIIEDEQQKCLEAAAQRLSDRALFVYAAPVFGSSPDLFRNITASTIAENSTFPQAVVLTGHQAWYYSQPGATGVVNQEFERVEQPTVFSLINELRMRRRERTIEVPSPSTNLRTLADQLRATVREVPTIADTARAARLSEEWNRIEAFGQVSDAPPAVTAFLEVDAFTRFYNVRWLVINDNATSGFKIEK